jgi:hypothetical protein
MWRKVGNYNVVDGDGNVEKYCLERNKNGTFRLKNEFGNISIELDHMNAVEFFRKVLNDVTGEVDWDITNYDDGFLDFLDDDDTAENDSSGDPNG